MSKKKGVPTAITAVLKGGAEALQAAIASGADISQVDASDRTALHHAAIDGNEKAVQVLLDAGADPNCSDSDGWTPLHFAARGQNTTTAGALLSAGALVDAQDKFGNTPLHRAVFESRGRGQMIELLLKHGAKASQENKTGVSPKALAESIANYDVKKWFADLPST